MKECVHDEPGQITALEGCVFGQCVGVIRVQRSLSLLNNEM